MAKVRQSRRSGKKRGRRVALVVLLVAALVVVVGVALFDPVYSYYRKGMGRCVQWGNSYELATAHLDTEIVQDAALVKQAEKNSESHSTVLSGQDVEHAKKVLETVQSQRGHIVSQESANPVMACTTKQLTPKLNAETKHEREWTAALQHQIAALHQGFKPLLVLRDADAEASNTARSELKAVAAGITGYAKSEKDSIKAATLKELGKAVDQANADVAEAAPYSVCKRDENRLYAVADQAVAQHNKARDVDCGTQRCVALTFDDGPDPKLTRELLLYLKSGNAKATFFEMGQKVQADGGALTRLVTRDDFDVESHTWSHEDLPSIMQSHHEQQQIDDTADVIGSATGLPVSLVRPPHGAVDEASRTYIGQKTGAAVAVYGVDSYDWSNGATSASLTRKIMSQIEPGAIVLMHDIHPHTVEAVPGVIEKLKKKGYRFVTIPELTGEYPRAGAVYYSRDDILHM
ncbi:polysaccharide deacetylase family protein [Bifidobacterium sp. ESL0704]|uniref:polysaccharide deacetylase family protein n=1 Tax=Bifidobacterium sp. ESL0704 TaxID=2983219 RepID=UPI0023F6580D|nr:polysaccharide deacetylase family protein [Bifidobacterium sp. ESL0704]WEV52341.1 polysaccharide deacetylase family protein [Bifidobacterium sp. ESL0704]